MLQSKGWTGRESQSSWKRAGTGVVATLLLTLSLSGCHKKKVAPPPPPPPAVDAPTATLSADPLAIDQGQTVTLTWRTTNATDVSIDGIGTVNPNGTQTVTPSNSTNFHLVAKGEGGTTDANVRVTVRVAAPPANTGDSSNISGDMGTDAAFHAAVKDIFFDYDSYDLRADAQTNASQAANYLTQHPAIRVVVGGYCDERGSAEYNLALGENRANAAKQALVNAGVSADRIRVVSYGKEKQFCTEANESCYQQNRRAQFNLDR
ncbi:peptidoglycan-associated lipoprotein Pal [Terriglobus aquaticus]|uniref:Peptidoglycan-associated protein n=1 Tax=Terriglobus aquaticus TaxID=940139 RepID=A0ABW9KLD5_9BACT|nr:peptidoglycan-associated lipoprotein Pal [Terriglobus aquaticus]